MRVYCLLCIDTCIYYTCVLVVVFYRDSYSTTLFMVGATFGEAGMPMAIGFLLEAFGPPSLPWTILMCSFAQLVVYGMLHFLGSQNAGHDIHVSTINALMDNDTEEYSKISLDTQEDDDDNGVEMVDL